MSSLASDRDAGTAKGVPPGRCESPGLCRACRIDHHAPPWISSNTRASSCSPRYGIPVSDGAPVTTVPEAVEVADRIGYPVVVKAQVQVGGRGKAGGIKLAANSDEARTHAEDILGMDIKGHVVKVVWIERASDIAEEYYASFTLDRAAKLHLGMLSAQGGVEIEQVAEENPDAIAKIHVDPVDGLTEAQCREWVAAAKLEPRGHRGRGRHPDEAVPRLRRGRRRPGGDQPADPHSRRPGARARRQGHARRQRRPSGTPTTPTTTPPRCATRARSSPTSRDCSTSGLDGIGRRDRQRRRAWR